MTPSFDTALSVSPCCPLTARLTDCALCFVRAAFVALYKELTAILEQDEPPAAPLVQAVLQQFPKAKITDIRTPKALEAEAGLEALAEVEGEWDPFEDD